jgi:hypothetical protein
MRLSTIHLFAKDDLKGATGPKKSETEKSATVPLKDGDGPLPPPKPVSLVFSISVPCALCSTNS